MDNIINSKSASRLLNSTIGSCNKLIIKTRKSFAIKERYPLHFILMNNASLYPLDQASLFSQTSSDNNKELASQFSHMSLIEILTCDEFFQHLSTHTSPIHNWFKFFFISVFFLN